MAEGEFVRVVSASLSLLGLGLVMGFSPTLYGVALHLLTRSRSPGREIRWLTAGIAAGASILFFVFRVFDPDTLAAALRGHVEELLIRRGVDLAAGSVFVLLAVVVFSRARTPRRSTPGIREAPGGHPRRMLLLGLANTVIGVSGVATMYVTGRVVTGASDDLLVRALLYGVFLVTLTGPYLAASWAWRRFPALAGRVTRGYTWLAARDLRPAFAAGSLIAGLVFLGLGVWGHGSTGS
ncbi:hypothetical protein N8K70_10385 [Microbacterium betulae]|uniref:GAP family protein n=1 Tax=Microbacterium betulae TaxID=2981139 RepID=A0AA97FF75_9MICO|nr:hypothetical protein [Microbacterium sp. AB]WOF21793.1 hypothetical protein N8K70_10385 [Microbacterium sp. AB]